MSDISTIMDSLNHSAMSTNYFHIMAKKAGCDIDEQVYTALKNYHKGRKEAYLSVLDVLGIQLDSYLDNATIAGITVEYTHYTEALPF